MDSGRERERGGGEKNKEVERLGERGGEWVGWVKVWEEVKTKEYLSLLSMTYYHYKSYSISSIPACTNDDVAHKVSVLHPTP